MSTRTKMLTVAALVLAGGAVLALRHAPAPSSVRAPEPSTVHSERASSAARAALLDPERGPSVLLTQRTFSEAELSKFDALRASPYIARDNWLVPQKLTPVESAKRQFLAARMAVLREAIKERSASEEEIDEFFKYRLRIVHYKMQLVTYMHVQAGGLISKHDPELSADAITDPIVRERYDALEAETHAIFEEQKRARVDHGLPAETFVSLAEPVTP